MEKLQAALQKARSRREAGAETTAEQAASVAGQPKLSRNARRWSALPEITPSHMSLSSHHVVAGKATEKATPFDIMRTKILLQMRQNNWTRLAITSPMPQCGKTTTACNLALGLGRQEGLRTMLFDLDLQDPSVGSFLGYEPRSGISKVLSGEMDFADQASRIGENVAVSATQDTENDPTRILLSSKTENALNDIQTAYQPDIMIFDTPSILVGDNTRAFLKNVDCALIIARANGTRYGHFDACEREIAEYTNVLGVVLNAFRARNVEAYID